MQMHELIFMLKRTTSIFKLGSLELAEGTGYEMRTIRNWNRKKPVISLAQFVDWANFLGYEVRLYRRDTNTTV